MLHMRIAVQQITLIQGRGFLKKSIVKKSEYFLFHCTLTLFHYDSGLNVSIDACYGNILPCQNGALLYIAPCPPLFYFHSTLSVTVSVVSLCFPPCEKSALAERRKPAKAILFPDEEGH